MYSEKYFKKHIFWVNVKRLLVMLIFSIIGCAIGVISSSYIVDILLFEAKLKPIIIAVSTVIFFLISLLITSNSVRYVQDCLWKIETLHTLNDLTEKINNIQNGEKIQTIVESIPKVTGEEPNPEPEVVSEQETTPEPEVVSEQEITPEPEAIPEQESDTQKEETPKKNSTNNKKTSTKKKKKNHKKKK